MNTHKNKPLIIKTIIFFLIAVALVAALNGCIKKPIFININTVNIGSLKDSNLKAQVSLKIYNPNYIKSTLKAVELKISYNNKQVGNGIINEDVVLAAKDTAIIPLMSTINIKSLAEIFPNLLDADSTIFLIEGKSKVKALARSWDIPLKEEIKINVKQLVIQLVNGMFTNDSNLAVKSIRLEKFPGVSKTDFDIQIQVRNSLPFNYALQTLDLSVYRQGGTQAIGHWKLADTISQTAGAVTNIPIVVEINNLNVLSEARLSDILHPNFGITLKGEAKVVVQNLMFNIPVEVTRKISLNSLADFNF